MALTLTPAPPSSAADEATAPQAKSVSTQSNQNATALLPSEFIENTPGIHGFTGRSPVMRQLILQMLRMAPHLTVATIEGEPGAGASLGAQALHAAGPAAGKSFIPCLATHFFSQMLAAGGPDAGPGWSLPVLRQAEGGMLFLDRVHQLSADQQKTLADFLHWFDDRHFQVRQHAVARSGEPTGETVPAASCLPSQIVFSTTVSLRHPPSPSSFREDLASRLCAVRFRLPPLAERREDIPLLAQIFIQQFSRTHGKSVRGLGPGTISPLLRYAWPGNVRELQEVVLAAALETESQWIRPIDLPPLPVGDRHGLLAVAANLADPDSDLNLDRAIFHHVSRVLQRTRGNKLRAAQLLGISRSTLYRILAPREDV